jgi:antitoxin (DNA-binding transcriptional repressor) of toxin-antitoxin stability system
MTTVNVRELRNHGGDVLDRVAAGENVIVTRAGVEIAELRAMPQRGLTAAELVRRRRNLPAVDPAGLRLDIDAILDSAL